MSATQNSARQNTHTTEAPTWNGNPSFLPCSCVCACLCFGGQMCGVARATATHETHTRARDPPFAGPKTHSNRLAASLRRVPRRKDEPAARAGTAVRGGRALFCSPFFPGPPPCTRTHDGGILVEAIYTLRCVRNAPFWGCECEDIVRVKGNSLLLTREQESEKEREECVLYAAKDTPRKGEGSFVAHMEPAFAFILLGFFVPSSRSRNNRSCLACRH